MIHQTRHHGHSRAVDKQRGSTILEGLIAIFIFSIAILGMVGMLAASVRHVSCAQYRTEAAFLADSLLAQIRMADPELRVANYTSPNGSSFQDWKERIVSALPGANALAPTVTFGGSNNREVTIVIQWRDRPDAEVENKYQAIASLE